MEPSVVTENGKYHLVYGTGVEPFYLYLDDLEWGSDNWPYAVDFSGTCPTPELPKNCPVCECRVNPTMSFGYLSNLQEKDEAVSNKYIFNFYGVPVNNNKNKD